MEWLRVSIEANAFGREVVAGVLMAMGYDQLELIEEESQIQQALDATASAWDYATVSEVKRGGDTPCVRLYLENTPRAQQTVAEIEKRLSLLQKEYGVDVLGPLTITLDTLLDADWENNWKEYYKPIEIGAHIAIVPQWEEYENRENRTVVRMVPGAAFGTGQHESTALCLGLMDEMDFTNKRVLDMGCGTGILGIAAALMGAGEVLAVDLDPVAVSATNNNAKENGVAHIITAREGDLLSQVPVGESYDVILCNIVANVILALLPQAVPRLASGGSILTSGIILEREEEIRQMGQSLGLSCMRRLEAGEWVALEWKKA
ncbi:50S ribosomal protein L11 methyltransferase [Eubacteriales bacterium OttesenSCG-928-M02]|nr:50S ribosomal protein L11 methyltransferase [Eubacteriales bacterium OttesenSCG-928-M02]